MDLLKIKFSNLSIPAAHPTPGIFSPPNSLIKLSYLPPANTANLSFS